MSVTFYFYLKQGTHKTKKKKTKSHLEIIFHNNTKVPKI